MSRRLSHEKTVNKTNNKMEFDPLSLNLEENGVCVKRNICDGSLCETFLLEADKAFDRMLALPGTMSSMSSMSSTSGNRHFITIATSPHVSKTIEQMKFSHHSLQKKNPTIISNTIIPSNQMMWKLQSQKIWNLCYLFRQD